jgi:NADH-quinone oxidoreductase subunit C
MHNDIVAFLNAEVSGCNAVANIAEVGDSSVSVAPTHIKAVCSALKNSEKFKMNVLEVISTVDFPEENEIELCYMLASFIDHTDFILKTRISRGDDNNLPSIDSVCDVWKSANYQEREAFDMMGVRFNDHPDHRRILCGDDWKGHPLRKDYVVEKVYNGMTVDPEHKINKNDIEFFAKMRLEHEDPTAVSGSWVDDHAWIDQDLASKAKNRVAEIKAAKKAKAAETSTEEKGE